MKDDDKTRKLRNTFKLQILQNPNYFGNLSELGIKDLPKPVLKKIGDTTFEELTCVGYNPRTDILTAIIEVKLPSGYLGDSCTDGSREFVRFYLDYGNGTWVDHGMASFNAHDLPFKEKLCYAVSIRLHPKKRHCCDRDPVLPKVRAILSWNVAPPANTPAYLPVWGNRLQRHIQIAPRSRFLCHFIDQFQVPGVAQIDPVLLETVKSALLKLDEPPKPAAPLARLFEKIDRKDDLEVMRAVFPQVMKLAANSSDIAASQDLGALASLDIDFSKFEDFLLKPNFNTTYEELHCVGLDRAAETLHGVIEIKRKSGYSGDLCDRGSREYIAFYLDFGSGWEYQGTTWVDVHDIDDIPQGGLWYQAMLPVKLEKHQQEWCKAGKARIRGILSWASAPPANQPNFVPHWGDREDCWIEIQPLPEGVVPGVFLPVLQSIGNMSVAHINGAGFATGDAVSGEYHNALDSPFGGNIALKGVTFFGPQPLEYRIMIKGPSDLTPRAYTLPFDVSVTTFPNIIPVDVTQNATGDWFQYLPTATVSVTGGVLAILHGLENGFHTVYLEFRQPAGPVLAQTVTKAFFVDNVVPDVDVEITSGAGNCGKFAVGDVISGTYSMSDPHSSHLGLSVTPAAEASGGHLSFTAVAPLAPNPPPAAGASASNALSYSAGTLTTSGAQGTWTLDTNGMDPCGYNIRIHGIDRTIVSGGTIGWHKWDIEGFCLD